MENWNRWSLPESSDILAATRHENPDIRHLAGMLANALLRAVHGDAHDIEECQKFILDSIKTTPSRGRTSMRKICLRFRNGIFQQAWNRVRDSGLIINRGAPTKPLWVLHEDVAGVVSWNVQCPLHGVVMEHEWQKVTLNGSLYAAHREDGRCKVLELAADGSSQPLLALHPKDIERLRAWLLSA